METMCKDRTDYAYAMSHEFSFPVRIFCLLIPICPTGWYFVKTVVSMPLQKGHHVTLLDVIYIRTHPCQLERRVPGITLPNEVRSVTHHVRGIEHWIKEHFALNQGC